MEVVVELLAERVHGPYPVAVHRGPQLPLRQLDTLIQGFHDVVARARVFRHGLECPGEIVAHGEDVAGEIGDRVLGGVLPLPPCAAARVLGLGKRPQQLILEITDAVLGRCLRFGLLHLDFRPGFRVSVPGVRAPVSGSGVFHGFLLFGLHGILSVRSGVRFLVRQTFDLPVVVRAVPTASRIFRPRRNGPARKGQPTRSPTTFAV